MFLHRGSLASPPTSSVFHQRKIVLEYHTPLPILTFLLSPSPHPLLSPPPPPPLLIFLLIHIILWFAKHVPLPLKEKKKEGKENSVFCLSEIFRTVPTPFNLSYPVRTSTKMYRFSLLLHACLLMKKAVVREKSLQIVFICTADKAYLLAITVLTDVSISLAYLITVQSFQSVSFLQWR